LIYLAGPYSHDLEEVREERFHLLTKAAAVLMSNGLHCFSLITHCHPMHRFHGMPQGWDFWEKYDRKMLAQCDEIWVLTLPGWKGSTGVKAEIEIAKELGIEVRYWDGTVEKMIELEKMP